MQEEDRGGWEGGCSKGGATATRLQTFETRDERLERADGPRRLATRSGVRGVAVIHIAPLHPGTRCGHGYFAEVATEPVVLRCHTGPRA